MKNADDFLKKYTNLNNIDIEEKQDEDKIKEFDKTKTKILKYVLYKKRTESEIRQKFSSSVEENLLEDVIENLKQNNYINDENYINRAVDEYLAINTLSTKEIRNKLYTKGISSDIIDTYFSNNELKLEEYEINCAKKIIIKKQTQMDRTQIEQFLYKKGYKSNLIKIAFEELQD